MAAYDRPGFLSPMPSYSGAEWGNRTAWAQQPKTADQRVLNANFLRSKSAHDLLMEENARQSEEDNALLASATPEEKANLFGKPRTPREARLQQIVQRDVNAKERGVALIPNWKQMFAYEGALEDLRNSKFGRDLRKRQFDLSLDQYGRQVAALDAQVANQQSQRDLQERQFASAEAERRRKAQQEADNIRRVYGNDAFNQMMKMEQFLQAKADEESRQGRNLFTDTARAAERGALPFADIRPQFGDQLSPDALPIVEGYARQYQRGRDEYYDGQNAQAQALADSYNAQLQARLDADRGRWFHSDLPLERLAQPIIDSTLSNRQAQGKVRWDAATGKFVPILQNAPAPQAPRPAFLTPPPMAMPQAQFQNSPAAPAATRLPEGTRFISNGTVFQIQNGRRVALGAARRA